MCSINGHPFGCVTHPNMNPSNGDSGGLGGLGHVVAKNAIETLAEGNKEAWSVIQDAVKDKDAGEELPVADIEGIFLVLAEVLHKPKLKAKAGTAAAYSSRTTLLHVAAGGGACRVSRDGDMDHGGHGAVGAMGDCNVVRSGPVAHRRPAGRGLSI